MKRLPAKTLGYIRHCPDHDQSMYYTGKREHNYDYPVTVNTTLKELTVLMGQNGGAYEFFASLAQRSYSL